MQYINYSSPVGEIILASNEKALCGLWFEGGKYCPQITGEKSCGRGIFDRAKKWLDIYFNGQNPDFTLPLQCTGSPFQMEVWQILQTISYGKTMTYGEIAAVIAKRRGVKKISAQAVGGAVGRNPISIIVPCHRVLGSNNNLTGYAGGLEKKLALLELEGVDTSRLVMPKKGTAL